MRYVILLISIAMLWPALAHAARGCAVHDETSALVCVESVEHSVRCRRGYDSDYYQSCDVFVTYHYSTDFDADYAMNADILCVLDVRYDGSGIDYARNERKSRMASHSLYQFSGGREELVFTFRFMSSEEVTGMDVVTLTCDVDDVAPE